MCNIRARYFQMKHVVKYLYVNIMYHVCISIQLMRLFYINTTQNTMSCMKCKLHKVSVHDKIFLGHTTATLTLEQNIWRHTLKMLYLSYFNLSIDTR